MKPPIRLVIADDHALVRATIHKILSFNTNITVVGEALDNDDAIAACFALKPDLLLLDMRMRGIPTDEAITLLRAAFPQMPILILSADDSPHNLGTLLSTGIAGYILKDDATDELLPAIHAAAQGNRWYSRSILRSFRAILNPADSRTVAQSNL